MTQKGAVGFAVCIRSWGDEFTLTGFAVLPDDVETTNELIIHLVERGVFEAEGDVRIFLRKSHAHQLTPKGRLWELADGSLNLRFHDAATMDKVEFEDGAPVLDWVVNETNFAIALMDNGKEEMGSVLSKLTLCFVSILFLTFWIRPPETGQEGEQECTRVFANRPGEGSSRL